MYWLEHRWHILRPHFWFRSCQFGKPWEQQEPWLDFLGGLQWSFMWPICFQGYKEATCACFATNTSLNCLQLLGHPSEVKLKSVSCKIHFDLSLCSYRALVSVQGGYHQTILATKRLHEEHLGFLLAHTGGPIGIRFQLSKGVHPLCIYRLVLVDQPLTSQVLCICTRWVIHLKNPSFLNLPKAHWIILTIKLLLRENSFKAQR